MTVSLERIGQIEDDVKFTMRHEIEGLDKKGGDPFLNDEYQIALIFLLKEINLLQQRDLNRERHHEFVGLIKQYESSKA